jgi:hypothetical protein
VKEDATRCLVCGADLTTTEKAAQSSKVVEGSRMPSITLSLPAAIGLLALFLGIGAIIVYFALQRQTPEAARPLRKTTKPPTTASPTATLRSYLDVPSYFDTRNLPGKRKRYLLGHRCIFRCISAKYYHVKQSPNGVQHFIYQPATSHSSTHPDDYANAFRHL